MPNEQFFSHILAFRTQIMFILEKLVKIEDKINNTYSFRNVFNYDL
jgi:hypothetical protein